MPQYADVIKQTVSKALVKYYDRSGKHILDYQIAIVYFPEVLAVDPAYLILDQSQVFTLTFQQNDQLIETLFKEYEMFAVFQENYRFKIDSDSFQFTTDPLPDMPLD